MPKVKLDLEKTKNILQKVYGTSNPDNTSPMQTSYRIAAQSLGVTEYIVRLVCYRHLSKTTPIDGIPYQKRIIKSKHEKEKEQNYRQPALDFLCSRPCLNMWADLTLQQRAVKLTRMYPNTTFTAHHIQSEFRKRHCKKKTL